jgi:hypothetical protein
MSSTPAEYKIRRDSIAALAASHPADAPPPVIDYTTEEIGTWRLIFERLETLYPTHAHCGAVEAFRALQFSADRIPSIAEVNALVTPRSGFRLVPAPGLVDSREFLLALARREFPCTLFIRSRCVRSMICFFFFFFFFLLPFTWIPPRVARNRCRFFLPPLRKFTHSPFFVLNVIGGLLTLLF